MRYAVRDVTVSSLCWGDVRCIVSALPFNGVRCMSYRGTIRCGALIYDAAPLVNRHGRAEQPPDIRLMFARRM